MSAPIPAAPNAAPRLSTGNPALDEMLQGGLMARRPYLIVGPSGTGKTKLALQFLCEGVRRGEECLVVTTEEPPNEMRVNHWGLRPDIDKVWVFDAIPDVMRYERAPFSDIAQVRDALRFADVPLSIRKTAELTSVEVTISALEQTLRMQLNRHPYKRLVIDSLTALQYFCMKGMDEEHGAQSFLRFLTDLGVTTLLTVESAQEDPDTAERMLARGEIRLFRWEQEGQTLRAVGVEKLRGSGHDSRLHPYRISPKGLDIRVDLTVSRDVRTIGVPAALPFPSITPAVTAPSSSLGGPATMVRDLDEFIEAEVQAIGWLARQRMDLGPTREAIGSVQRAVLDTDPDSALARLADVATVVRAAYLTWRGANLDTAPPTALPPGTPQFAAGTASPNRILEVVDRLRTALQTPPSPDVPAPALVAPPSPRVEPVLSPVVVPPSPQVPADSLPAPPPAPAPSPMSPSALPPAAPAPPPPAPTPPTEPIVHAEEPAEDHTAIEFHPEGASFGPTFDSLATPPTPPAPAAAPVEAASEAAPKKVTRARRAAAPKKAAGTTTPRKRAPRKKPAPVETVAEVVSP
ncbi:MAG: AAA family ATPase [Thermoplasmata archaeon]|nr:AAA family ATPase [Thermoplasmata archaeon]